NEKVAKLYDETHPAVKRQIAHVIEVCRKHGVETSICGQAGSRPEMAKFLVEKGISSISVNADAAKKISEIVTKIEEGQNVNEDNIESASGTVEEGKALDPEREEEIIEEHQPGNVEVLENEHKPEEIPVKSGSVERVDIEDEILRELDDEEDEYHPGDNGNGKKDIPSLNEAIPVGNDMLEQMASVSDEMVEQELEEESREELVKEWKGEREHN
ncbi:MAG: hypothetical protein KC506_01920, partial [Nanoarchaeota archaeon]|nr:hypothetical protein [Nanoarchaeota archaeon]